MGFDSVPQCPSKFMSTFVLKNKIKSIYIEYQAAIRKVLESIPFVCEAVDIWSIRRISFMGITIHYVDSNILKLKSHCLSCAEFESSHTNEPIAEHLQLVHSQFSISSSKIIATVTDNAANFVKAIREFGNQCDEFEMNSHVFNDVSESNVFEMDVSGNDVTEIDHSKSDVTEIYVPESGVAEKDVSEGDVEFPEIQNLALTDELRCASHTFNLIATKDISQAQMNRPYKIMYSACFAELNGLWS